MLSGVPIVVAVDEVMADRRKKYQQTGEPKHLEYENAFKRELAKKGRANPEIRRNFYLEDTVEEGNFVAGERLRSCARGSDVVVPMEQLCLGRDWARTSDHTWFALTNEWNDVIDWLKVPHVPCEEQCEIAKEWLECDRGGWKYLDRIIGVRNDSTGGTGDAPNEMLAAKTGLPMGEESYFVFSTPSKNDLYVNFEAALSRELGDPMRFGYPADHPLAFEFEEQMVKLVREYFREEGLSVHHPDEPGAVDDAPDCTALALFASKTGKIGDILFG